MLLCRDQGIKLFVENKLDGLITPGLAAPAVKHGQSKELLVSCCYTAYWNTFGVCACDAGAGVCWG